MPLAFSFFTSKSAPVSVPAEAAAVVPSSVQEADFQSKSAFQSFPPHSPFPTHQAVVDESVSTMPAVPTEDWQTAATLILPPSLPAPSTAGMAQPEKRAPQKGLAALVVHQSEKDAPPLNRRPLTSPFPSSSPESLAEPGFRDVPGASPIAALSGPGLECLQPAAGETPSSPGSAPLEQGCMRQDQLQEEIELVKNDLFGAVMGVSALKDRLDGLESQLSQMQGTAPATEVPAAVPVPSRADVESWISSWMETHLSVALERALAASQEQMMASLSTLAFFRAAAPLGAGSRQTSLAQPPVILTATPV